MRRHHAGLVALLSGFGAAALLSGACGQQDYPATVFRCDPSQADACPGDHVCCSTDPVSIDLADLSADARPNYAGGSGTPVFSAANNSLSRYGRCVDRGRVVGPMLMNVEGPAAGCPLPCNPTWDEASIGEVCGVDAFCCQTDDVGEDDCVFDPALGTAGCWRPVTGHDLQGLGGLEVTLWATTAHDTHQDPRGLNCEAFVAGLEPGSSPFSETELRRACFERLTVANQRGFCTPAGGQTDIAAVCGLADPAHRDACEQLNDDEQRSGCE